MPSKTTTQLWQLITAMRIRTADANRAELDVTGCGIDRKKRCGRKADSGWQASLAASRQRRVPPWQNTEEIWERTVSNGGFGQEAGGASTRSIVASSRWVSTGFSKNAVAPS